MNRFVGMILISALGSSTAALAQRNGSPVFLNGEEIMKIMEKLPPIPMLLSSPDTVTWSCQDADLSEHCSDLDGCTVNLHLQHKLDANDQVRGIKEYLYFENSLTSSNKKAGLHGYTRQSAGGEHGWITGTSGLYTVFAPWGWVGAYNYRPAQCPGQNGRNSPAHSDPFTLTIISHPHVNSTVIIED
jgi:hypothetical protein